MNILIPDNWLRDFLKTKATPKQIKEYVSLCGPSVERVNTVKGETVYDVEITTNRVDSYSIYGFAREAATILPMFDVPATLVPLEDKKPVSYTKTPLDLTVEDKHGYTRRVVAVKVSNITLKPSPAWLANRLELVGQRPLNNIVDITNYIMWETGHPSHAFDYDRLTQKKIVIREAKKGEEVITLDKKVHTMVGGELIFDDGTGRIIDVPGVMGTANTVVTPETKNVLLFIENSDPAKIRFTSMTHAIRTQAAIINEKDPDPELVKIAIERAATLAIELTGGTIGSALFDRYPKPFKPYSVTVTREKLDSYIGTHLSDQKIHHILMTLGFETKITDKEITVSVPSMRRDVSIDVDIIEEVARIYGYHNIATKLPDKEPPVVMLSKELTWEEEIKIRLRDWGYTELYTYSMISQELMDAFGLDIKKTYKITNPLSNEWEYMRPALYPSVLTAVSQNLRIRDSLKLFELSMVYRHRPGDLPKETPTLVVALTGKKFLEAKGLVEAIFRILGVAMPENSKEKDAVSLGIYNDTVFGLGEYGSIGEVNDEILGLMGIRTPVILVNLDLERLIADAHPTKTYLPIPKYPPVVEDLAFTVPPGFQIGPFMAALAKTSPRISDIALLDMHKDTRTIHVTYMSSKGNLTDDDIHPIREKIIRRAEKEFGAAIKTGEKM